MLQKLFPVIACLGVFVIFLHPFSSDGDFYHHLNAGRYIIEHHALPYIDDYTFTANGQHWIDYSWASGLIFYLIFAGFGPIGINILVALTAVLSFYLLYKLLKVLGIDSKIIYTCLAICAPTLSIRWPNRPEIFSYPLLISLLLIYLLRNKNPKLSLFFPLIILLWANLYGSSVFVGLGLIGLFVFDQLIKDRAVFKDKNKIFYLSTILSFPVSLLNGYGLETIFYILFIPQITSYQGEWMGIAGLINGAPSYFIESFKKFVYIYVLFVALFIVSVSLNFKLIKKYPLFAGISFSIFLPFFVFRQLAIAIILTIPFFAFVLNESKAKLKKILIFLTIISALVPLIFMISTNPPNTGGNESVFPIKLIGFINKYQLFGNAYTSQSIGAFITYHLYPKVRVSYDTRDDLFSDTNVLSDFYTAFNNNRSIIPVLNKYHADIAIADLLEGQMYRSLFYSQTWAIVYTDGKYIVAVPRKIAQKKHVPIPQYYDPFN